MPRVQRRRGRIVFQECFVRGGKTTPKHTSAGLNSVLILRRRSCAVSKDEGGPHPSRRGQEAAPQDEVVKDSSAGDPSKLWWTLLREGLDAFLDLGAAHAVAGALVGGFLIQLAAGKFVDRALHAAHRDRRIAGQNAR
jgi:hypothetical protein